MAGHSKWHNIQHRKGAQDKIRGKLFTKHAKLIAIAAKSGDDPNMNPNLKTAIDNAKSDNVPNDNIKRAIKKGSGNSKDAANYQELSYEAYAPGGIALIIEALTDNSNRTFTNIRTIVTKNGGNMASSGSVNWMFSSKAYLELLLEDHDKETVEMDIIESGAEDMDFSEDRVMVTASINDLSALRDKLREKGYKLENIKKIQLANDLQELNEDDASQLINFIDKVEEDDDVTEVFTNADF